MSQGTWLYRNLQQFQEGLVFQADRPLFQSTLGSKVEKKKEKSPGNAQGQAGAP